MTFAWPQLLWLLAVPAALLVRDLVRRNKAGAAAAHPKIRRAEAGTRAIVLEAPKAAGGPSSHVRPRWCLCAGLVLAIAALARPQWGRIEEPMLERSREILIAMDLSRSMLTPDVPPSRLDRSKLLVQSLLDRLSGERVGLLVFSGTAFVQAPLSADYEILREFLPTLGPDYLPEGGTNYADLIDAAAGAFGEGTESDRFLIILSDGGATDDDWKSHVGKLTDKGVHVIALGIGTAAGGFIPDGSGGFMKDERGAVVKAALDSATLRELADKTGGAYRDASQWVDLAGLLNATVEAAQRGRFVENNTVRYVERFQWALGPALLCLLLSFWLEFPVHPRSRDLRPVQKGRKAGLAMAAAGICAALAAGTIASAAAVRDPGDAPADAPGVLLGRIVGRLSAAPNPGALDWAELGHETVTWGQQLQGAQSPVPPGPVHDALAAADAGSALDAKATDWPKLRADLEALLKTPDKKKDDQQKNQQQQQQNQQNQQQQQQQSQGQNKSSSSQPQQNQGSQGNSPQQNEQNSIQSSPKQNEGQQKGQNAEAGKPDRPQQSMQQVGGQPQQGAKDPAAADPALAGSLEKLGEVRDQDSPGELFQMIENNEPHPKTDKNAKNW